MRDTKVHAIPDDALEALARCLYPSLVAFYESDAGRREFAEWQARRGIERLSGTEVESGQQLRRAG